MNNLLIVELDEHRQAEEFAEQIARLNPVVVRLSPNAIGVTCDMERGAEIVRVGYPSPSDFLMFRPLEDVTEGDNVVSGVIRAMILRRKFTDVLFSQAMIWPCVRKGVQSTPARIRYGGRPIPRTEPRPVFHVMGCVEGSHWDDWAKLTSPVPVP